MLYVHMGFGKEEAKSFSFSKSMYHWEKSKSCKQKIEL